MPPREHNRADATARARDRTSSLLRAAVYVAVALCLLVALWALATGADRDLWTTAAAILCPM